MHYKGWLLILLVAIYKTVHAADLLEIYQLAEVHDPIYKQEEARYHATVEAYPKARAELLPSITLSANSIRNTQDISSNQNFGSVGEVDFNSHNYSLNINQPLFNLERFFTLKQAKKIVQKAEIRLSQAQQTLMLTTAERYLDVLISEDQLRFATLEVQTLKKQLNDTEQRFKFGLNTQTDVADAKAGYDLAVADEIKAQNDLQLTHEAVYELVGEHISTYSGLNHSIPINAPEPLNMAHWTITAQQQNLSVMIQAIQEEEERQQLSIKKSARLPTVDLIARHSYDSSGGRFGASKHHHSAIGVELNMELYQGGRKSAEIREAKQNYIRSTQGLEQTKREAKRATRAAILNLTSGHKQIKALKQAVYSNESALTKTTAGFKVGTKTSLDVIIAQRAVSRARTDYSRAIYSYLLNTLRLKQSIGTLSIDDLKWLNQWFDNT